MGTDELSPELMILQDRIARSTQSEKEVPKSRALENSQSQPGTTYGAYQSSLGTVEFSGHYSQVLNHVHFQFEICFCSSSRLTIEYSAFLIVILPSGLLFLFLHRKQHHLNSSKVFQAVLMVETTSHHLVFCTWGKYGAPALYQSAPNPQMFIPSQAPQVQQKC